MFSFGCRILKPDRTMAQNYLPSSLLCSLFPTWLGSGPYTLRTVSSQKYTVFLYWTETQVPTSQDSTSSSRPTFIFCLFKMKPQLAASLACRGTFCVGEGET